MSVARHLSVVMACLAGRASAEKTAAAVGFLLVAFCNMKILQDMAD